MKKQLYCCNANEENIGEDSDYVKQMKAFAANDGSGVVVISGKLESEITALDSAFLKRIIHSGSNKV